jgi:hypothetical protein
MCGNFCPHEARRTSAGAATEVMVMHDLPFFPFAGTADFIFVPRLACSRKLKTAKNFSIL